MSLLTVLPANQPLVVTPGSFKFVKPDEGVSASVGTALDITLRSKTFGASEWRQQKHFVALTQVRSASVAPLDNPWTASVQQAWGAAQPLHQVVSTALSHVRRTNSKRLDGAKLPDSNQAQYRTIYKSLEKLSKHLNVGQSQNVRRDRVAPAETTLAFNYTRGTGYKHAWKGVSKELETMGNALKVIKDSDLTGHDLYKHFNAIFQRISTAVVTASAAREFSAAILDTGLNLTDVQEGVDSADLTQALTAQNKVLHDRQRDYSGRSKAGMVRRDIARSLRRNQGLGFRALDQGNLPGVLFQRTVSGKSVKTLRLPNPVCQSSTGAPSIDPVFRGYIEGLPQDHAHVLFDYETGESREGGHSRSRAMQVFADEQGSFKYQQIPSADTFFHNTTSDAHGFLNRPTDTQSDLFDAIADGFIRGQNGFSQSCLAQILPLDGADKVTPLVAEVKAYLESLTIPETCLKSGADKKAFFLYATTIALPQFVYQKLGQAAGDNYGRFTHFTTSFSGRDDVGMGSVSKTFQYIIQGQGEDGSAVTLKDIDTCLFGATVTVDKSPLDAALLSQLTNAVRWAAEALPKVSRPNLADSCIFLSELDGDAADDATTLTAQLASSWDSYLSDTERSFRFDKLEEQVNQEGRANIKSIAQSVLNQLRAKHLTVKLVGKHQDESSHTVNKCLSDLENSPLYLFNLACNSDGSKKSGATRRLDKALASLSTLGTVSERVVTLRSQIETLKASLADLYPATSFLGRARRSRETPEEGGPPSALPEVNTVVDRLRAFPYAGASILNAFAFTFNKETEAVDLNVAGLISLKTALTGDSDSESFANFLTLIYGLLSLDQAAPEDASVDRVERLRSLSEIEEDTLLESIQGVAPALYQSLVERLPQDLIMRQELYISLIEEHVTGLATLGTPAQSNRNQNFTEALQTFARRIDHFKAGVITAKTAVRTGGISYTVPGGTPMTPAFNAAFKAETKQMMSAVKSTTHFPQKALFKELLTLLKTLRREARHLVDTPAKDVLLEALNSDEKSLKGSLNVKFGQRIMTKRAEAVPQIDTPTRDEFKLQETNFRIETERYQELDLGGRPIPFTSSYDITSPQTPTAAYHSFVHHEGTEKAQTLQFARSSTIDPFRIKGKIIAELIPQDRKDFYAQARRVYADLIPVIGEHAVKQFCGSALCMETPLNPHLAADTLQGRDLAKECDTIRRLYVLNRSLIKVLNLAKKQNAFSQSHDGVCQFTYCRHGLINGDRDEKEAKMLEHESAAWRFLKELPIHVPVSFLVGVDVPDDSSLVLRANVIYFDVPIGVGGPQRYGYCKDVNQMGLNDLKSEVNRKSEQLLTQLSGEMPEDERYFIHRTLAELNKGIKYLEDLDGSARSKRKRRTHMSKKPLRIVQRLLALLKMLGEYHCKSGMDRTEYASIMSMMNQIHDMTVFDILDVVGQDRDKKEAFKELYQMLELQPSLKALQADSRGVAGNKGSVYSPTQKPGGAAHTTT